MNETVSVCVCVCLYVSHKPQAENLYGLNMLTPPKTKSECEKFLAQITDFFSILLWIGCGLCFVAYALQATVENLALALVLGIVVLITGVSLLTVLSNPYCCCVVHPYCSFGVVAMCECVIVHNLPHGTSVYVGLHRFSSTR